MPPPNKLQVWKIRVRWIYLYLGRPVTYLLAFLCGCSCEDLFLSNWCKLTFTVLNHSFSFLSFSRPNIMTTAPPIGWMTEPCRNFGSYRATMASWGCMIEQGSSSMFQTSNVTHMLDFLAMLISGIKASEMLVAPRISECFDLLWSALVC